MLARDRRLRSCVPHTDAARRNDEDEAGAVYPLFDGRRRTLCRLSARAKGVVHVPRVLFLSASTRNRATPISKWSWSKIVRALGLRAGVPKLTTHSFRHLCLTDLARAGWDAHEIASFAGHRSLQSTLLYIHLSARDLAGKFARGMAAVHDERMALLLGRSS
jgi:integrase